MQEELTRMQKCVSTDKMCIYSSMNKKYKKKLQNGKSLILLFGCFGMWASHFNEEARNNIYHWGGKQSFPTVQGTYEKRHILTIQRTETRRPQIYY